MGLSKLARNTKKSTKNPNFCKNRHLSHCVSLFQLLQGRQKDLKSVRKSTFGSIIPAVASRACHKLPLKYTRVTSLVLYINKISMSFCLFICLFVCLFVLKLLLGKYMNIDKSYIIGSAIFREPKLSILEPDTFTQ